MKTRIKEPVWYRNICNERVIQWDGLIPRLTITHDKQAIIRFKNTENSELLAILDPNPDKNYEKMINGIISIEELLQLSNDKIKVEFSKVLRVPKFFQVDWYYYNHLIFNQYQRTMFAS